MITLAGIRISGGTKPRIAKLFLSATRIFDFVLDSGGVIEDPYLYLQMLGYTKAQTSYIIGVYYTLREGGNVEDRSTYYTLLL